MSEEQFQELSTKLDKLLETQQGPSTSDWQSQLDSHRSQKVVKLETQILDFMKAFAESTNSWTEQMQKVIHGFAETLKAEKEETATLRFELQKENSDLSSTLQSKIDKLRDDLASENELMDLMASKTTKI
ncbi:hypothetical protein L1887_11855 [Cichorium endivia]|nr:hypothetical protein L1887_11855 [Cichorium endivia]